MNEAQAANTTGPKSPARVLDLAYAEALISGLPAAEGRVEASAVSDAMNEHTQYWLALGRVDGLGVRGIHSLIRNFTSPGAVYTASLTELESCGLPSHITRAIRAQKGVQEAEKEIAEAERQGICVLGFSDPAYPPLLKQIADPPLALYVKGDVSTLCQHAVAMVGSRRPSAYGSSVAHRLAADLAQRQVVIVSGMARGIDSAVHRGALEAGGKTVAVLGSGLDVIYPRENKKLADRIVEQGAMVSEFPLGAPPLPENFPIRNRIISGLSLGVTIVEAAEYSGSLITARLALEQNREVFAVPGNITSPQSFGPNLLIKQGAKLVDQWLDVVEEFPPSVRVQLLPPPAASEDSVQRPALPLVAEMDADQKAVYEVLRTDEALFVDAICGSVSLPQPRVLAALLDLEMNGLVRQLPGMNFVRKL
ncbi:MAG TPA: DNA-processing protein DprA [Terriglobia bacterium]|nr:DNA-processing protein DprA [Terriglobia bacterium]